MTDKIKPTMYEARIGEDAMLPEYRNAEHGVWYPADRGPGSFGHAYRVYFPGEDPLNYCIGDRNWKTGRFQKEPRCGHLGHRHQWIIRRRRNHQ